ncbi:type VI secretion system baseplate subunit TssF [Deminuibacter soli]|uniref:Type VI secretion system baseplate subunit TssF n=1 Tax=Deminuibacter soli TaxID=2291815 RepID=A0A3E1NCL8_9BACT|nr:type VI secretion system baseplate subunit TssF [Deminuibacter soli]RFM25602.1 hypothetical protein DXN05_24300 [Deminuibacter soli]
MEEIYHHSRESIRNRLLKHAVSFWGIRSTTDLDPLVKLLIEALSAELFNLSNDLRNTESRLLDRLARLLTPDILTAALPAHALLKVHPAEATDTVSSTRHFVYTTNARQQPANGEQREVFFTPVYDVPVHDVQVVYTATGNRIQSSDLQTGRKQLLTLKQGKQFHNNSLWIGLRVNQHVPTLNQLSLYFECHHYQFGEDWYPLLALAQCTIGGMPVSLRNGLHYVPGNNEATHLLDEYETMHVIAKDTAAYYDKHYLNFAGQHLPMQQLERKHYPDSWAALIDERALSQLQEPLVWIELRMPALMQQSLLDDMDVYVNVFPVLNRRLHTTRHRFKGIGNIIPIRPAQHESFLAVHRLTDSSGKLYKQVPYTHHQQHQLGSYSIRMGGAERFDSRNARETIDYLFELLRDESAAFSAYGYDFLTNALKNLQQGLTLVEQKARQTLSEMTESTRYIIIKPEEQADTMHLDYWTTQGDLTAQLRVGAQLVQFENASIKPESIQLISKPVGGRSQAQPVNRLQAYKYSLLTRDRIITNDDIRNFCLLELNGRLSEVSIERGVMLSPHPKEGLRKTTDIYLHPVPGQQWTEEEWQHLSRQLLQKLQSRSSMHLVYRLIDGSMA